MLRFELETSGLQIQHPDIEVTLQLVVCLFACLFLEILFVLFVVLFMLLLLCMLLLKRLKLLLFFFINFSSIYLPKMVTI